MVVNKDVIHAGDFVRIINPELFVRVGYPMCIKDTVESLDKSIIIEAMQRSGVTIRHPDQLSKRLQIAYDRIAWGLAFAVMVQKSFGGDKRSIYTKRCDDLQGAIVQVSDTRRVVTGEREPGYYDSGSWEYPPEWEPPYLINQKVHVILSFSPPGLHMIDEVCKIERCHVEKVSAEETE